MDELAALVREAAILSGRSQGFQEFADSARPSSNDLIVFNSSFLYRDVETKKALVQLAVQLSGHPLDVTDVVVVEGLPSFNGQFKKISRSSGNIRVRDLSECIGEQIAQFGQLAFVLIGVAAPAQHRELMAHSQYKLLIWDQAATEDVAVEPDGMGIRVRQVHDEAAIWLNVSSILAGRGEEAGDSLRDVLCQALNSIQDGAVAELAMPTSGVSSAGGLTERIADGLASQTVAYRTALATLDSPDHTQGAMTEIYRLAYTFASDALTYLQLLVSVCDLKPILLWLTMHQHLRLNDSFGALPWRDSRQKPSLKNYRSVIGDARNSAFHNALPFRHSLSIVLPSGALEQPRLTFFAPYGASKNSLTFQDKELVEVLLRFTRARERLLPRTFWVANAEVMEQVVALLRGMSTALQAVNQSAAPAAIGVPASRIIGHNSASA